MHDIRVLATTACGSGGPQERHIDGVGIGEEMVRLHFSGVFGKIDTLGFVFLYRG